MSKLRDQLLEEIEAHLKRHAIGASIFGRNAINDTALVSRLRKGKDIRLETADKIRAYMARVEKEAERSRPRPTGGARRAKVAA